MLFGMLYRCLFQLNSRTFALLNKILIYFLTKRNNVYKEKNFIYCQRNVSVR